MKFKTPVTKESAPIGASRTNDAVDHPTTGSSTPPVATASNLANQLAVEPFIDKHEVARRLGRTTRTVDNLMRRGFIPYYKVGYRVQFRWSEIQSHLAETCRICRRS